jgi:hypothetical protein
LVGQGGASLLNARIIERHVEPPKAAECRLDQTCRVFLPRDIGWHEHALGTGCPHFRRNRLAFCGTATTDEDG